MTESIQRDERMNLLRDLISMSLSAAHGAHSFSEQQLNQTITGLVRNKLLTAEDSYKLQDSIKDTSAFEKMIDARIDRILEKKGILSRSRISELEDRLGRIEQTRQSA